jgi:transposase
MSILQLTSYQRHRLCDALSTTDDASYYRRLLALLELDRGRSLAEVAEALGVTRQSVYNWARAFRRAPRPATLDDHYGAGRPTVWTAELQALLQSCFRQRPDELGYAAVNWTVPVLQEHLERCTGLWLSDDTIRRELQRLRYVWKRYRYVLPPDPEREKKTADPPAAPGRAAARRQAGGGRDGPAVVPAAALRLGAARAARPGAAQR